MVLLPSRGHPPAAYHNHHLPPPQPTRRHSNPYPCLPTYNYSRPPTAQPVAKPVAQTAASRRPMDPRYHHRPSSPGGRRLVVPGRSSAGTVGEYDQYYNTAYRSPRTSAERVTPTTSYSTQPSAATRSSAGYDAYTGRPRRSTLTDSDRARPANTLSSGMPIRTTTHSAVVHAHDRPSSPLARTYDARTDPYITPGSSLARPSSRQGHSNHSHQSHRKVYSIDDGKAVRVDPREADARRRDSGSYRTAASKAYHAAAKELNDDGYSYTDPASMYKETEPRWRQRSGSVERGSRRPVSMLESYGPRTSLRDLGGPPVTTRGFDKLGAAPVVRTGSLRDHRDHHRTHSRETSRERSNTADSYAPYRDDPYAAPPARSASVRQPATYVHQDSDDRGRRDDRYGYRDEYDERSRRAAKPFEDRDIESRGFGIRPPEPYQTTPRDEQYDRRPPPAPAPPVYPVDPVMPIPSVRDYMPDAQRDERWEQERVEREYRDRELRERERLRDSERPRDRDQGYDTDRERERRKEHDRSRDVDRDRRDRDRDHMGGSGTLPVAAAAAAAAGVGAAYGGGRGDRPGRDHRPEDDDDRSHRPKHKSSDDSASPPRRRHYASGKDDSNDEDRRQEPRDQPSETLDPDEEYRRRVQRELERNSGATSMRAQDGSDSDRSDRERERRHRERQERRAREDREHAERAEHERSPEGDQARRDHERHNSVFEGPVTAEPGSMSMSALDDKDREGRVRIVSPPRHDKDSPPPPRGILRRPTEKFPEDPNPIREGVAPLNKDKDIPPNARWTKIARKLVNPEALEQAQERFEERMDCVIVLRVLTKEQIQELATRTKEIRKARGNYKHSSNSPQFRHSPLPSQRAPPSAARSSLQQVAAKGNIASPPLHPSLNAGQPPSRRDSLSNRGVRFTPSTDGDPESRKKQREQEDRDDKTVYRRTPRPKGHDYPSDDDEQQQQRDNSSGGRSSSRPRSNSFPSLLSAISDRVIDSLTRQKEDDHREHRHERRSGHRRHKDRSSDEYESGSEEEKPRMLEAPEPQVRSDRAKEGEYAARK